MGEARRYDTVRRLRPLARRRFRTRRPFLVLMRSRKPCVLRRRLRLGWKVRFMGHQAPCPRRLSGRTAEPQMVDGGRKTVNKSAVRTLWYRRPLSMTRPRVLAPAAGRAVGGPGRFSTIVEKTVEISGLSEEPTPQPHKVSGFAYSESRDRALFSVFLPASC